MATEVKPKSEFDARLDGLIKPYVDYWKLLKNYVKDFEEANKSKFSNMAWDRIKQLEKDIRKSAFAEMQYQAALECESRDKRIKELEAEVECLKPILQWEEALSRVEPSEVGVISSDNMARELRNKSEELITDYRIAIGAAVIYLPKTTR